MTQKSKIKLIEHLTKATRTQHGLLFSSCRNALFLLCKNLNFTKSDQVIVQDFICDSLPWAIEKAGATVLRSAVNKNTLNLDPITVKQQITNDTKAILFVHTYGNPSGIIEIAKICKEKNIILIEDIAHSLFATANNQPAGSFGDYVIYSLTKQLVGFGGGALLSNYSLKEIEFKRDTKKIRANFLDYPKRLFASLYETRGFWLSKILIDLAKKNADLKMTNSLSSHHHCTNIEAWIAKIQIKYLKIKIQKRRKHFQLLQHLVPKSNLQEIEENCSSSFNYFALKFESRKQRNASLKNHQLFLSPWPNSSVSEYLIFLPNNPNNTIKKIKKIANAATNSLTTKN